MKHKKLKIFIFIILLFLLIVMIFGSCKKTKALESELHGLTYNISELSQSDYNFVAIYNLGLNDNQSSIDFNFIGGTSIYLNLTNTNQLRLYSGSTGIETYVINSRLLQCQVVYDNGLYLIVYSLDYALQYNQTNEPIISGISRTMITRFLLDSYGSILNDWQSQNGLNISLSQTSGNWLPYGLIDCSYIDAFETPSDINSYIDKVLSNYITYNKLIHEGYLVGNENGYLDGFDDGEERGYSDGYDAGYDEGELIGHAAGYEEGANDGYAHGFDEGYRDGWDDGQAGETAITPAFNTLSAIFGGIGSILAVQLVPGVPLGLFFLVPLFFAVLGLILWIWRRN